MRVAKHAEEQFYWSKCYPHNYIYLLRRGWANTKRGGPKDSMQKFNSIQF